MKLVIALGGNAISSASEEGNISQQFDHSRETAQVLVDVVQAGHQVVLTHGNGPQVGNILRRSEIAAQHNVYPIPLELCVADSQAGMGYMISQCLLNELQARGLNKKCATLVTTVLVDAKHPDFERPTKPIGIFYAEDNAGRHMQRDGWKMTHVPKKGWRRVVASPPPLEIVELDLIRRLFDAGDLVICCGGGGIPVAREPGGGYRGIEAVIDKDRTSALLAASLEVDLLVVLTGVPKVCLHFGTPQERALDQLSLSEAKQLMAEGHFPSGSMGPKIEAAIDFVSRRLTGRALITDAFNLLPALQGQAGTWIVA